MKKYSKTGFAIILLAFLISNSYAQTPINQRSWQYVATSMPDDWYGTEESKTVAENVLLYQRSIGGWPKNIPMHRPLSEAQKKAILLNKDTLDAILDNSATTTEMKFLARMFGKTGNKQYKKAFITGLNFILEAQYENGGWPMFYPLKKGYYTHITFNDDAIVNILNLLRDIYNREPLYTFVASKKITRVTKDAYDRGLNCILKTQIIVDGKPTVWCAQHDEITLLPVKARSYELPSFSGAESVGIVKLLMEIDNPSEEIIRSVTGAVEWFESHKINNMKVENFKNNDGKRDRRIVYDPAGGTLWARFSDLETGEPFVCDRDGIKKKTMEEIGYERRTGYSWYTNGPQEVINDYPAWKAKWIN
jgi:pectinesterase